MYRVITIEREFGSGAGEIALRLSQRLGWMLWDHALTEEIAKAANVECSAVERCEERLDSRFRRLAKTFFRGSYERSMPIEYAPFDADRMVEIGHRLLEQLASRGNCIFVGRGSPYFLRKYPDTFHVFLYAPRAEKIRRLKQSGRVSRDVEELVDSIDRDRRVFVKHYFGADWPTRSLYHLMINTSIGDENVMSTILNTMHSLDANSGSNLTEFQPGQFLPQP